MQVADIHMVCWKAGRPLVPFWRSYFPSEEFMLEDFSGEFCNNIVSRISPGYIILYSILVKLWYRLNGCPFRKW